MSKLPRPALIVHLIYQLDVGGLENSVVSLINNLPQNQFRHAVICLSDFSSDFRKRIKRADVQVYSLHEREGVDFHGYVRLWSLLRDLKPDIMHSRNLVALGGQVSACLAGVPIRIHADHGLDDPSAPSARLRVSLMRRLCKYFVHHFIPLSLELETFLVDSVGIRDSKISRIQGGVSLGDFYPASGDVLDIFPNGFANQDAVVIGTVGRMQDVKGQMTLIRAFIALVKLRGPAGQKLRLVVIGDGPLRDKAEALLIKEGVRHLAWLPGERNDVAECMRAMKIFVLPSLSEGISNVILEAMACGLPVVATNVGGNNELVAEDTGVLVDSGSPRALVTALSNYLDDLDRATAHGMAGRLRVKKLFGLDLMVERYQTVYDRLLDKAC